MKYVLFAFIIGGLTSIHAQTALPGNEDGQWRIYSNGNEILLPRNVHDLGNFDEKGLAFFAAENRYGVIDSKGTIVIKPSFRQMSSLGGGWFVYVDSTGKNVKNFSSENATHYRVRHYRKKGIWTSVTTRDSLRFLLNSNTSEQLWLEAENRVVDVAMDYVYLYLDDRLRILDPMGDSIRFGNIPLYRQGMFVDNVPIKFTKQEIHFAAAEKSWIIRPNEIVKLPSGSKNIVSNEKEYSYSLDGTTYLVDWESGKTILSGPYDFLERLDEFRFKVGRNDRVGVYSTEEGMILPIQYSYIEYRGKEFGVYKNNLAGIANMNGKLIIPCKYQSIYRTGSFYHIRSVLGNVGVVSSKTKRELLSPVYNRVKIEDKEIRAWTKDRMILLRFDENHKVDQKLTLNNVISFARRSSLSDDYVDSRLYSIGWFSEKVPTYDKEGFKTGEVDRWGLMDQTDSVIVKPRLKQPIYVPLAAFSLVPTGNTEYKSMYSSYKFNGARAYDIFTGRPLKMNTVMGVDTTDLFTRSYTRFKDVDGSGIIKDGNEVVRYSHVDEGLASWIRVANVEEIGPAENDDPERVPCLDFNLNNDASPSPIKIKDKEYYYFHFENAKWNYIDTGGNHVLDDWYEFLSPTYKGTSLAKLNGRWGVLKGDSLTIETKYHAVERLSQISDTTFQVKLIPRGKRYVTPRIEPVDLRINKIIRTNDYFVHVEVGRNKRLLNKQLELVSGEMSYQKIIGERYFYSKKKGKYTLYDENGIEEFTTEMKPQDILNDEFVLVQSRGKFGLLNFDGDTVLPMNYKLVEMQGPYIVATGGTENGVFDHRMKKVKKLKTESVLVDQVNGDFALVLGDRVTVYDATTQKKKASFKSCPANFFYNGRLMGKVKTSFMQPVVGERINLNYVIKSWDIRQGNILIQAKNGYSHYYDQNWTLVSATTPVKRANWIGNDWAYGRTKEGFTAFSADGEKKFPPKTNCLDDVDDGIALIQEGTRFYFVDEQLTRRFNRDYREANSFLGDYASIKEGNGWTSIDREGRAQTLAIYDELTPVNEFIFETSQQALYGVYRASGKEILPPIYQRLTVLNENLIQCVYEGEIQYFDANGKRLGFSKTDDF